MISKPVPDPFFFIRGEEPAQKAILFCSRKWVIWLKMHKDD